MIGSVIPRWEYKIGERFLERKIIVVEASILKLDT